MPSSCARWAALLRADGVRVAPAAGSDLPPRTFRPAGSEILKFCRRETGGKQYLDLERALDRLQAMALRKPK